MIEINNLSGTTIDKNFLKKVAERVLEREKKKKNLSVVVLNPKIMKELNKKYRGEDGATDVLSFAGSSGSESCGPDNELGEILICPVEIKKNAKIFNARPREELARVLIHGILHLLGWEHEKTKKEAENMKRKEENYLKKIFSA